ncbi:hypothetical protein BSZ31_09215 [Limnobacter sp. SAORIC-690]|jgi:hypothetical protein|uniref:porin n=1 Tax=Limnobacter TaxID=131079 RepID=UPI000CF42D7D|nr:porin [Limnobacter sp. P1]PQJ25119.1 hypothetical protein BSZ31_09215 [Limnobacter sp. SAORIC-690]
MISKKLVAASILAAMGTSAHAIGFKAGEWEMDISGSVNAYYTSTSCDNVGDGAGIFTGNGTALHPCGIDATNGVDKQNIQNGLLPGFIIFSASTTQKGYDLKAVISIDPGTSTDGGTSSALGSGNLSDAGGGRGQIVGDQRRVYFSVGNATMGTVKAGRDIGLFGQNAILNDMSLLAVGGGSAFNGALNTTLGSIGSGYVYTQFQPQITYTTPAIGNLSVSAGAFQPVARNASVTGDRELGFQGLATYSLGDMGKLWGAFISQGNEQTNTNAPVADISGFEVGGTLNFGSLGLTANYFTGDGLGTALIGFGGSDALAQERESQGYLVQATYKVGDTKFGVNYGVSSLDATANDRATATRILDESEQLTLGVYHNLTPSLTIAGEYITNTVKYQLGGPTQDAESDTIAIGAILFF